MLWSLLVAGALADALPEAPECPHGTVSTSSHSGVACLPGQACDAATACPDGTACREIGLCVRDEQWSDGGRLADQEPRRWTVTVVDEAAPTCDADADCASGYRCDVATRCVESGILGTCGCFSIGTFAPAGVGLVLLATLARPRRREDA